MTHEIIGIGKSEILDIEKNEIITGILAGVRDEVRNSTYIMEAIRVLPVNGLRSAIAQFWNAVVDDLRKKIIYRSVDLFNKEVTLRRKVESYEDFQQNVLDFDLIEGAYKIGVIGLEAKNVLQQARNTRNFFAAHPDSSEPTHLKAYSMIEDCVKYVLSQDYPTKIINIDEFIEKMGDANFTRENFIISNAFADLPKVYKNELSNRFMSIYIHVDTPMTLMSNVEFAAPILWKLLTKEIKIQTARRVDQELLTADKVKISKAIKFVGLVDSNRYLSHSAKTMYLSPLIQSLNENLDNFGTENECVKSLSEFSDVIPSGLLHDYVNGITQTYVGRVHGSAQFSRTDFYADTAASLIPDMFSNFNEEATSEFIKVVKTNSILKNRLLFSVKLRRLRTLGDIISDKVTEQTEDALVLEYLVDETKEKEFFESINKMKKYPKKKK